MSESPGLASVLVTGATGFIGRALVQRLVDGGTAIRILTRQPPPAALAQHPLITVVRGDLADAAAVDQATAGIATVYHLGAAMSGPAESFDASTARGTGHIVESCVRHGVRRLVYMSSLAVIDAEAGQDGRPIDEHAALERFPAARGHYTRVKTAAEHTVRHAVETRRLPAVVLRPGEVVNAGRPLLTPGVAQRVGPFLVIIGDGQQQLPLVHLSDVVDALVSAAKPDVPAGAVFHLVDESGVTQNEIVAHAVTHGVRARVVHVPRGVVRAAAAVVETVCGWLGRPAPLGRRRIAAATARRQFDCSAARRVLQWRPSVGARAAFEQPLLPQ